MEHYLLLASTPFWVVPLIFFMRYGHKTLLIIWVLRGTEASDRAEILRAASALFPEKSLRAASNAKAAPGEDGEGRPVLREIA